MWQARQGAEHCLGFHSSRASKEPATRLILSLSLPLSDFWFSLKGFPYKGTEINAGPKIMEFLAGGPPKGAPSWPLVFGHRKACVSPYVLIYFINLMCPKYPYVPYISPLALVRERPMSGMPGRGGFRASAGLQAVAAPCLSSEFASEGA